MIRVYIDGQKLESSSPTPEERERKLSSIIQVGLTETEPKTARKIENRKHRDYPSHITALKARCKELKAFIVADTETLLIENEHKPYAVGLMLVRPGEEINNLMINTYFSEDYFVLDSFEERSTEAGIYLTLSIGLMQRGVGALMPQIRC